MAMTRYARIMLDSSSDVASSPPSQVISQGLTADPSKLFNESHDVNRPKDDLGEVG
jgi:hypothetical protein